MFFHVSSEGLPGQWVATVSANQPEELPKTLSSKPCDRYDALLCRTRGQVLCLPVYCDGTFVLMTTKARNQPDGFPCSPQPNFKDCDCTRAAARRPLPFPAECAHSAGAACAHAPPSSTCSPLQVRTARRRSTGWTLRSRSPGCSRHPRPRNCSICRHSTRDPWVRIRGNWDWLQYGYKVTAYKVNLPIILLYQSPHMPLTSKLCSVIKKNCI